MAICCREVLEYIELVKSGKILVSKENNMLIDNIVIPILENSSDIFFDETTYKNSLAYIEKYYYEIFPYQKFLNFFHYLYDGENRLLFNEYLYYMGRGNGKDGFISPHANFMQTPYFGIKNYDIPIIANSELQAKDTFAVVYNMLEERKKFMKPHFHWTKELVENRKTASKLFFNTANGKTKDGQRPGCLIFNELHAYENYEQIKVHMSGLGKREHGRTIYITTDGDVRDGPLDDMLELGREKLKGMHPKLRLFPFICKIDNEDEAYNIKAMEKANPSINYIGTLKAEIEDSMVKMETRPALKQEYFTKRANFPKRKESTAIASWENIKACTRDLPVLLGKDCILCIDYASFRDFVSVGFLFYENGEWIFTQHTFVCKGSPTLSLVKFDFELAIENEEVTFCEGEIIEQSIVFDYIDSQIGKYNILSCVLDSYRYALLADKLTEYGFVKRDKNNKSGNLILCRSGEVTHTLLHPVLEDEFIKHNINFGKSRMMRWYTNNVKVTPKAKGNVVYDKINPESRKTDGFMAFVHGFSEREILVSNKNNDVYTIY